MRNPVLVGAAGAAAVVLLFVGGGVAFAADPPPAAVKAAICASASVEAVSGAADVAASRAQRELDAAKAALPAVMAEQDRRAAALKDAETALAANPTSAALKTVRDGAKTSNDEGNEARAAADQRVKDAETRLAAAQLDQRNAVDLERRVAAFVGTRGFAAVKTELCTPPATTSPTTTPTVTPTPVPVEVPRFATCSEASAALVYDIPRTSPDYRAEMDTDNDGVACERPTAALDGGSQVELVPNAVDTGRA